MDCFRMPLLTALSPALGHAAPRPSLAALLSCELTQALLLVRREDHFLLMGASQPHVAPKKGAP